MVQRSSYKRVMGLAILLFFIFSILGCLIPSALAGGGSGEPMNPVPIDPGGTSYKSPSLWQYLVLYYFKHLKSSWRWVVL